MRIKRTFAPTMREALLLVKQEQGMDAVILGNKKVPGGVEIMSAIDFDEVAMTRMAAEAAPPRRTPEVAAAQVASDVASDAWIGAILNDGRREPTLGPVAIKKTAPVFEMNVEQPVTMPAMATAEKVARPAKPVARKTAPPVVRKPVKKAVTKARTSPVKKAALKKQKIASAPQPAAKPVIDEVKNELQNLRDLMESQLSVLQWDRFSQKHPIRTVLLNLMSEMGLGADVCDTVLSHLDNLQEDPHKVWQQALGILARCMPVNRRDLMAEGGRIALVGSTGVGKTTTIAKLAARFRQVHGKRSVAMISTDQFRIGAQEQLQNFARLLEIPLLTAGSSEELCDRLDMLADKKMVLIDTAGMSQQDLRLSEQFHRLQAGAPAIKPYLVLSANTQLAAMNQTVVNFKKSKLAGAFVTKLDEAASLGAVLTTSIRHRLPLTYCGTGQKVPEDLEPAKSHRVISRAVSLMQQYGEHYEQESLALRYNHIINKNQAQV
ncbi:MAG: flagellar biosynthesis protein FlhF [Pseudomonadota bacterium]